MLDFFVENHRGYLVLEHIEGRSLRELVKQEGALPEPEVVTLALQMCHILRYLHRLEPRVVHRDFTPDNLMLYEKGHLEACRFQRRYERRQRSDIKHRRRQACVHVAGAVSRHAGAEERYLFYGRYSSLPTYRR